MARVPPETTPKGRPAEPRHSPRRAKRRISGVTWLPLRDLLLLLFRGWRSSWPDLSEKDCQLIPSVGSKTARCFLLLGFGDHVLDDCLLGEVRIPFEQRLPRSDCSCDIVLALPLDDPDVHQRTD